MTSTGRHTVRRNLLENSGLGLDAYHQAYRAIGESARRLESAEAAYRSGTVPFGRPPVSHDDVEQARAALQRAETRFADLRISRPNTLRALRALDGAVHHRPSGSEAPAARAARIAAQSRNAPQRPRPPHHAPSPPLVPRNRFARPTTPPHSSSRAYAQPDRPTPPPAPATGATRASGARRYSCGVAVRGPSRALSACVWAGTDVPTPCWQRLGFPAGGLLRVVHGAVLP